MTQRDVPPHLHKIIEYYYTRFRRAKPAIYKKKCNNYRYTRMVQAIFS